MRQIFFPFSTQCPQTSSSLGLGAAQIAVFTISYFGGTHRCCPVGFVLVAVPLCSELL
jgi:hypothetical protein